MSSKLRRVDDGGPVGGPVEGPVEGPVVVPAKVGQVKAVSIDTGAPTTWHKVGTPKSTTLNAKLTTGNSCKLCVLTGTLGCAHDFCVLINKGHWEK